MNNRRKLLAFVWAALTMTMASGADYPAKPVRYVVPFPAGASPDIVARLITDRLSRMWGQQVLVENRSGAGGTVGAAFAAKALADGYTLFQPRNGSWEGCNVVTS